MEEQMLELDGSRGPDGGAALRAALALSALTRRAFAWQLSDPAAAALLVQQACVRAAAQICSGGVESSGGSLLFRPGTVRAGTWSFEAGGAAPCAALLQALLLPLSAAGGRSQLRLTGGTHVPGAPTFHDLALCFAPHAEAMGLGCELSLERAGFEPEGGGTMHVRVHPVPRLSGLDLVQRGLLHDVRAIVLVAGPGHRGAVELERQAAERLRARGIAPEVEALPVPARGRGLALVLVARFEKTRVSLGGTIEPGRTPAEVARASVDALGDFLGRRGAVDALLAEQLLLPAAVAASRFGAPAALGAGAPASSRFSTSEVSGRLVSLAEVARAFLGVEIRVAGLPGEEGLVEIRPGA